MAPTRVLGPFRPDAKAEIPFCSTEPVARDLTRAGLAAVLNEFAAASACDIQIDEEALCLRPEVRSAAELLGLDVLYVACEGALAAAVPARACDQVLRAMRAHPDGANARVIGEAHPGSRAGVIMRPALGGSRIVDILVGEQLPRMS